MDKDVDREDTGNGGDGQVTAQVAPTIFVEWIEDRPLGLVSQVGHDLSNDDGSSTGQQ